MNLAKILTDKPGMSEAIFEVIQLEKTAGMKATPYYNNGKICGWSFTNLKNIITNGK